MKGAKSLAPAPATAFAAPVRHGQRELLAGPTLHTTSPYAVIVGGQVIGMDPDANVRTQILRDYDLCGINNCN